MMPSLYRLLPIVCGRRKTRVGLTSGTSAHNLDEGQVGWIVGGRTVRVWRAIVKTHACSEFSDAQ